MELQQTGAVTVVESAPLEMAQPRGLIEVIFAAAKDPTVDVEKFRALIAIQRDVERHEREKQFMAARARLRFPPIRKSSKGQRDTPYAAYEDIQGVVEPILAAEGFSMSFSFAPPVQLAGAAMVEATCTLSHRAGHSVSSTASFPVEKVGQMNNIQAAGSLQSYAKRYLTASILNLRMIGADDDGAATSDYWVTADQAMTLETMLADLKGDVAKFLKMYGAQSFERFPRESYSAAVTMMENRKKRGGQS